MKRRVFLQRSFYGSLLVAADPLGAAERVTSLAGPRLTILHTNDWHSRIDPFPAGSGRNANQGGAIRRAALIDKIRSEEELVLLLDSGDVFQGTPYFNFFAGELEFKLMSQMGYDAGTIGNHDFDAGIDGLAKQLPNLNFPLLSANYDFKGTPMEGKTLPYHIIEKGPIKIGLFGLGIELDGLVPAKLIGETKYQDPVERANFTAKLLKENKKCDLVICLSHLGYRYRGNKVSDVVLAGNSRNIDLILGGHTHTFMRKPDSIPDLDGEPTTINQVGFGGLRLGRLDIGFDKSRSERCVRCNNLVV
ncbi:metallophosphatase [Lewinellaceae bacterium SD302]|nr:metallophosphatase [Lewinellaceae bacterium SD302]